MKIPDETIEEIKYRNPIEEIVSSYVTLKRAGSNLTGLCPFHSEKSPSFTVFPPKLSTGYFTPSMPARARNSEAARSEPRVSASAS